ncbi:MAG: 7-cyano-7-deazaguanine synthase QueC [bacterium]
MTFQKNKSLILLSGGLDSVVSLACSKIEYNIVFALTFDYGQRAKNQEITASSEIAKHFNIEHKIINLPWLAEITHTALVNTDKELPAPDITELDIANITKKSAKNVWIPNRNGLFINIAACFVESMGFNHIIFGANKEEAATFPDNSEEFLTKINKSLEYSTLTKPKVISPLMNLNKKEIVKIGIEKNIPFDLIRSCYTNEKNHCGKCESCLRLKRALYKNNNIEIIKLIFEENIYT